MPIRIVRFGGIITHWNWIRTEVITLEKNMADIFYESQQFIWDHSVLCHLTNDAVLRTRVFPEQYQVTRLMNILPTYMCVTEESVLETAR